MIHGTSEVGGIRRSNKDARIGLTVGGPHAEGNEDDSNGCRNSGGCKVVLHLTQDRVDIPYVLSEEKVTPNLQVVGPPLNQWPRPSHPIGPLHTIEA